MDNAFDLNAVVVFVRIVESGSLSAAARSMKMPKTTVSKRLASLEESLGVALIARTTRKLSVTEAGRAYFAHCQESLRLLEQARAEVTAARSHPSGHLKITAPVDIAHTLLPRVIHAFVGRHPGVRVELLVANRLVDLVGEGVDLAIRAGPMRDSGMVGRKLIELTANVYASHAYLRRCKAPLQPKDLSSVEFIGYGGANGPFHMVKGRSSVKVDVNPTLVVDDFETIKELVVLGTGAGWLPDFVAKTAGASIVPAVRGWRAKSVGQVHFLYAKQRHPSANVKAFIDVAMEVVPLFLKGELAMSGGDERNLG